MSQHAFRRTERGIVPGDWRAHALCTPFLDADPLLFDRLWGFTDPAERPYTRLGKQICVSCPVRETCLAEAIVDEHQSGIYGGLNLSDRKYAARIIEEAGMLVRDPKWAGRTDRVSAITRYIQATPGFYGQVAQLADRLRHQRQWEQRRALRRKPSFPPAHTSAQQNSKMQPLF
jgi:WhiB family redox-sensing transcriptional regulator